MVSESNEPPGAPPRRDFISLLLHNQLPLESETCLFIFVNILDYFMTYVLLYLHIAHESNPIARWFLEGWGLFRGLLYYKLALVLLVVVIAQVVATRKLQTARWLLLGSSIAIGAVVIYSIRLFITNHGAAGQVEHDLVMTLSDFFQRYSA